MGRKILRGAMIAALLLLGLGVAALPALRPPEPLALPPPGVVLTDVTVVNPGHGRRPHRTVRVVGPVVASISGESTPEREARGSQVHRGGYVLPGLIDLHVHHPPGALATDVKAFDLLHLAYGVTTVRDCGSFDGSILRIRSQVAAGAFAGPRIFACGPLIDGDPPFWPGSEVARDTAEGERIVDRVAASGVDCIKAYSGLSPDALRGVRVAAHRHHLMLVGHVPIAVPLEAAHIDDVQHLTGVPGKPGPDTAPGLIPALLAGWESIDDARIDTVVRIARDQEIAFTPTIVVMKRLIGLADYPALLADPAAHLLPRYYRGLLWKPGAMPGWSVPPMLPGTGERILQNFRKVVGRLHAAGVTLHVGTDSFNPFVVPGVSMHEELRELVASGLTPEEAWEAATRGNGAALPLPEVGVVAPGAPADLLVFREDPTRDLGALSTLEAVVANGRYYRKDRLDAAVARYRDYFRSWLYDHLTMAVFPWFLHPSG